MVNTQNYKFPLGKSPLPINADIKKSRYSSLNSGNFGSDFKTTNTNKNLQREDTPDGDIRMHSRQSSCLGEEEPLYDSDKNEGIYEGGKEEEEVKKPPNSALPKPIKLQKASSVTSDFSIQSSRFPSGPIKIKIEDFNGSPLIDEGNNKFLLVCF